ncbi:type I secretion system permease/ATPase [Neorhizobium sp. P12A]|uniref:type I secretion system permease/ATPase n=1 Tax=Neorhizobium sp. P12A TaxID=2268027 RepID=UPI0011EFA75F|nr:type I secretion system permease/ATPase [Neorhizobium sp. P12A]KAA0686358.1 type I secretion system permease/ATPase [Neorhizobium sp. P12A]
MIASSRRLPSTFFAAVLSSLRQACLSLAAASAAINVLALTGSFFMLQVYDRVIPGRSLPTLAGLAIIAATLFAFQGVLELLRTMLLSRIGMSLDERLSGSVFDSLIFPATWTQNGGSGLQPVRDLDQVRSFLSGVGPTALFDLPWIPLYLVLCFLFHFWIGFAALAGTVVLIVLTVLAEVLSQRPNLESARLSTERLAFAESARRNWEAVVAMGFSGRLVGKWNAMSGNYRRSQLSAGNVVGSLAIASKILRMMLQSTVLGVGAILVIRQEATGGIMIASSILVSRALAPVELAIGQWRAFVSARQSWTRLRKLLEQMPTEHRGIALPNPTRELTLENVSIASPGSRELIVRNVSFKVSAGTVLGVIGPSASGKSSLVRAVVGLWPTVIGTVRLDQAALSQWKRSDIGRHVGYLPQDVGLFEGSIAENISRFDEQATSEAIISAAKSAGIYEMVVQLSDGFDTLIGEGGARLSAGQRQRIALARALYGDPFLVVLDEPNSNLDADGEAALTSALLGVRARGGIAIVVAHRPSALAAADKVLVMTDGQMQAFGPKDAVLRNTTRPSLMPGPIRLLVAGEEPSA